MNGMLSTTNVAQQTDADRDILAWRAANPEEAAQPTPAPDDILVDTTVGTDIDFEFDGIDTPDMIETAAEGILIEGELDILDQGANAVADVPMSFEDIMSGGNEEQILGWANDNNGTYAGQALLGKHNAYNFQGAHGTLDKGYKFDGSYADASALINANTNQFHSGDRDSEEFKNSTDIIATPSFVKTYVDGIGKTEDTDPQKFFNTVHNMFTHNPTGFAAWSDSDPVMALRFHALAATDQFSASSLTNSEHQAIADAYGNGLRLDAGWGEEYQRDGSVWATNFNGDISKDVNNPESGGDFWKIGTPEKVTDGLGNYVKDNPIQAAIAVASLAAAGYGLYTGGSFLKNALSITNTMVGTASNSFGGGDAVGAGLGSESVLAGNGTGAGRSGNLFDLTKISPAATAILGPMIDNTEGLIDENIS